MGGKDGGNEAKEGRFNVLVSLRCLHTFVTCIPLVYYLILLVPCPNLVSLPPSRLPTCVSCPCGPLPCKTVMMYPFLFHQLMGKMEPTHPNYSTLEAAADAMNKICRDIDEIGSELGQMAEK